MSALENRVFVKSPPQRRSTAVSQALRALHNESFSQRESWSFKSTRTAESFRILVASDRLLRSRSYALAFQVYQQAGYIPGTAGGLCVAPYDALPQTLTLLVEDAAGRDCATISLVCDAPTGLPCDEIYRQEVDALRQEDCRLAEVTRLAIAPSCQGAKELLLHLFLHCYVFARVVRDQTDLLVEVNPHHVGYYRRLLRFQEAGPERPCARVQGAPAILLRLNFAEIEATVRDAHCTAGRDPEGKRLVAYPYSQSEEAAIARFLAHEHQPMSAEEMAYFRLNAPASGDTFHSPVL